MKNENSESKVVSKSSKTINDAKETVNKIVNDSDYVYDIKNSEDLPESYEKFSVKYYLKDIKLPYINIYSVDASVANREISKIYDDLILVYSMASSTSDLYKNYEESAKANYETSINENILSVMINYNIYPTVSPDNYVTYNFDLTTGEFISFDEIYEKSGFNSENIDQKVKSSIKKYCAENLNNLCSDSDLADSYKKYEESKKNNKLLYFLNKDGKLSMVLNATCMAISSGDNNIDVIEIK